MPVLASWSVQPAVLPEEEVERVVEAALQHGGRAGIEIEVVFVDDDTLTEIHARFLGDPTPTDVITFDLGEEEHGAAGELYVSVDCARREAEERGVELQRELALYLVHGALHLCGFDDHEPADRAAMRAAERAVMRALDYPEDSSPHDRRD